MAVYVMSDVHGCKEQFDAMMNLIKFHEDDLLYILGDVIDRGAAGIALLQMIRRQKNMILLMGNHEHMMLEYYEAQHVLKHGGDMLWAIERIHRWEMNQNTPTKQAFEALSEAEQTALLQYIRGLPLAFPDVEVQHQHFYLVHANWHPAFQKNPVYLEECLQEQVDPMHLLWDRIDETSPLPIDKTLIFGHTVTLFYQQGIHPFQVWSNQEPLASAKMIGIDCGCAADHEDSRLACLRLDDRKVFYV